MKNYVIINGTNSNTLTGLMINELPPITKPEMRTQVEEIDGRDGDIITKLGYSAYDKTITIGLWGTSYDVDNIIKFFNKEGTIVFSNEPDKYYNFTQVNGFDIERLLKFKTASITFHCQPFKYPIIETQKIIQPTILTSDGESITINNTASDSLKLSLKGNTSQSGTPTPSSPIPVSVVSGDNDIVVCGKNLFDKTAITTGKSVSSSNGALYNDSNSFATDYINVKGISNIAFNGKSSSNGVWGAYYDDNKQFVSGFSGNYTTLNVSSYSYVRFGILNTYLDTLQIEIGSSSTSYVPYTSQTYEVDLPVENLVNIPNQTISSQTTIEGIDVSKIKGNVTYSLNYVNNTSIAGYVRIRETGQSTNLQTITLSANSSGKGETTLDVSNYNSINIVFQGASSGYNYDISNNQLEAGSKANTFVPYGTTPIELCKIGTYQDYFTKNSDGQWCKYNAIGKLVLDGTQTLERLSTSQTGKYRYICKNIGAIGNNGSTTNGMFSDKVVEITRGTLYNCNQGVCYSSTSDYAVIFYLDDTSSLSLADTYTYLATKPLNVYYILATPYLSLIEDNNLIEQLDNIQNAMSYEGTTNIGQVNNDKPFIISASAVQSGTNEITINNIGNVYSKPLIALEGSGNVDIYLDDTQILKANVESKMNIDIAQLEAYNPDTSALLNRQVIGNYNSMTFQPGNNKLTINGSLSKATITNYTRYL